MNDAARALLARGVALRRNHDIEEAFAAITEASRLAPDDSQIALALAHVRYDSWRPAVADFAKAAALLPGNMGVLRAYAAALNVEGQSVAAESLLGSALTKHPEWIDGHKALATMRATAGEGTFSARSFADACDARPHHVALRMAWFHTLVVARDWDAARRIVDGAKADFGPIRAIQAAEIFLASESDIKSTDPKLFDTAEGTEDVGLALCHVRFLLRTGRFDEAAIIAERYVTGSAARNFWPYLSLGWQMSGDARTAWLDGDGSQIGIDDIAMTSAELAELEAFLRSLLVLNAPFPEQSVVGGVQTDRHLFFNPHPVIQRVKHRIAGAVQGYVDALPPRLAGHPLLDSKPDALKFEGSWSVLLRPHGAHTAHTHNRGWLSSAFYVAVPNTIVEPQGFLELGAPPCELGLPVEPHRRIEPKPGRLVLFPSTMWHGTVPFDCDDRLTVAFDIAIPDPKNEISPS